MSGHAFALTAAEMAEAFGAASPAARPACH